MSPPPHPHLGIPLRRRVHAAGANEQCPPTPDSEHLCVTELPRGKGRAEDSRQMSKEELLRVGALAGLLCSVDP